MKRIIIATTTALMLSGCGLYRTFETPKSNQEQEILGQEQKTIIAESPVALPSWQEFFKDKNLQELISKALESNVEIEISRRNIEDYQTMLLTSKLAYLPSIGINNLNGSTSSFGGNALGESYSLPVSASWEIDLFGKLRNAKQQAKANLLRGEEYARQTKLEIVTLVANSYYTLIMLDEQLKIANEFIENQSNNLEAIKQLKSVGMQSETAVNQAEASLYNTKTTKSDLELQISLVENSISLLINETPQHIERSDYSEALVLGSELERSISLEILSNRPDVKAAEYSLRYAFYGENVARARMYPSISLSGSAGWTNSLGAIINPGNLLLSAIGSLTAPIFNKGVNRANLNIAKSEYERAMLRFQSSLLGAGNEVNGLLQKQEKIAEKREFRAQQIESNEKAYKNSQLMMQYSSVTYLEVLISQASLLSSRLTDVGEWMLENQNGINLYKALGGEPVDIEADK